MTVKKDHTKGKMPKNDGNLSPKTKNLPKNMPMTSETPKKKPKAKKSYK
jgi:hypothetical protein